jgi:hypothetical protein
LLGLTLAAFSELTREVFLPDQSVRIVGAARKLGKRYFTGTLRKFVQDCAKVVVKLAALRRLAFTSVSASFSHSRSRSSSQLRLRQRPSAIECFPHHRVSVFCDKRDDLPPITRRQVTKRHVTGDSPQCERNQKFPGAVFVPLPTANHILLAEEPAWKLFREELSSFLKCTNATANSAGD